ncbi:NCS1 family transporter [Maledivibacter halophilus]|uniref:Nucleobase:cation symporter-1, NCS1 family n=1 Tax=Maledivibacter halophilus TaxID=36842 RepID=A0A1T5MWJ3_9FIRM|nr:NCS1 family transporter [Maledivibacter halophilus]SKC92590.1 nucleobase:cation symporter-1, NCS1 family [Maledivibacter halophilus]
MENKAAINIDEHKIVEKGLGEESLLPQEHRIMDKYSYLFTWLGGCVSIGTFMMGASLVPPAGKLNLLQALLAMIIGNTVIAIALTINGQAGHKYGIPFIVQTRSSFGIKGARIPGFIRAVPAVIWFGVQSWVGASALNNVAIRLTGYDNIIVFFIVFQIIQISLSVLGFKGIKWVENIGSVCILASLIYMFYVMTTTFQNEIFDKIISIPGTWGIDFWGGTTAFLGIYTTMILNVSDYMRELDKKVKPTLATIIQWLAIVPATLFMGLIGLMAAGVTGEWDPIKVFTELMPNSFVLIVALLFIALAQITTNVLNNGLPPAYVMMDVFGITYKKAALCVGILSFFTFPWKIATEGVFILFVQIYSAFLGPIFSVMVVDYYFVRKKKLDLNLLYDNEGPFNGINWTAIIAICVGAMVAMIEIQLSWYSSLIPAGLTYYLLMKYWAKSRNFLPDTK